MAYVKPTNARNSVAVPISPLDALRAPRCAGTNCDLELGRVRRRDGHSLDALRKSMGLVGMIVVTMATFYHVEIQIYSNLALVNSLRRKIFAD
jgi:hypothetical protein